MNFTLSSNDILEIRCLTGLTPTYVQYKPIYHCPILHVSMYSLQGHRIHTYTVLSSQYTTDSGNDQSSANTQYGYGSLSVHCQSGERYSSFTQMILRNTWAVLCRDAISWMLLKVALCQPLCSAAVQIFPNMLDI